MELSGTGGKQGINANILIWEYVSYVNAYFKEKKAERNNHTSAVILQKAARVGSNNCFCFLSVPSAISVLKRMEAAITWWVIPWTCQTSLLLSGILFPHFLLTKCLLSLLFQQCSKCKHGKLDLEAVFSAMFVSGDSPFSFFCDMKTNCEHGLKYFPPSKSWTDFCVIAFFPTGCDLSCVLIQFWFGSCPLTCLLDREVSRILTVESISQESFPCNCICNQLKILSNVAFYSDQLKSFCLMMEIMSFNPEETAGAVNCYI